MHLLKLITGCLLLFIFSSCEKVEIPADEQAMENYRSLRTDACSDFAYASDVFYLRNAPKGYIVKPVKALVGTFSATPYGLIIDPNTGAININASETGLTYSVSYTKAGTNETCTRNITIAGIDFANSLHVLSQNDVLVTPTFNGIEPSMVGTSGLSFDVGGLLNSVSLRSLGLAVDPLTATIDLKKTLTNGLLGSSLVNGASITVRLHYKINDASQGALNHIDLRLTYYKKISDVPASLLKKVQMAPTTQSSAGARSAADDGGGTKPRPPEIVIVG